MNNRQVLIVNLSGRGDKDAEEVALLLGDKLERTRNA